MKEALLEDEHIKDRKLVVDVEVPNSNGKVIKQMASPIKLSECPVNYKETGYPLGYHTESILKNLGYSDEEISNMKKENVVDLYVKK